MCSTEILWLINLQDHHAYIQILFSEAHYYNCILSNIDFLEKVLCVYKENIIGCISHDISDIFIRFAY